MGLFYFLKKKPKQVIEEERAYSPYGLNSLIYNSNSSYSNNKAMLLSTVYRCVDVIGDSVAQLIKTVTKGSLQNILLTIY